MVVAVPGSVKRSPSRTGFDPVCYSVGGTGKTTATRVPTRDPCLDTHKVDLTAVVTQQIGETEKARRGTGGPGKPWAG